MSHAKTTDPMRVLRRELVARGTARGMSAREIADEIALGFDGNPPMLNPDDGQPFSHVTIFRDQKFNLKRAVANTQKDMTIVASRHIMRLNEVIRKAWEANKLDTVLKALDQLARVEGTYAPTRIAPTTPEGVGLFTPIDQLTEAELNQLINDKLSLPTIASVLVEADNAAQEDDEDDLDDDAITSEYAAEFN